MTNEPTAEFKREAVRIALTNGFPTRPCGHSCLRLTGILHMREIHAVLSQS